MKNYRINLMYLLYQHDLYNSEAIKFEPTFTDDSEGTLFNDIISKLDDVNLIIENNLYNYSLSRLSFLDRAIIRLATYEMLYTNTPIPVIINEAIELSKKYTNLDDMKQHKFNNRVLDNISKNIKR